MDYPNKVKPKIVKFYPFQEPNVGSLKKKLIVNVFKEKCLKNK